MQCTFHHRALNSPFGDPAVYVRLLRERRALLFDLGDISALDLGEILKISDVFVTHTHIDHFIGFDTLLRASLRRERPLNIYGPGNLADCVEGKLGGYSWNLIETYPLKLEVYSVAGGTVKHSSFHASEAFRRAEGQSRPFAPGGTLLKEAQMEVRAVSLSHGIQCLGYSLIEDRHINIDKQALEDMGLRTGPWLSELKGSIRRGEPDDTEIIVDGAPLKLGGLMKIVRITRGQKVSYASDVAPGPENEHLLMGFIKGSDTLYCEAYFMDEDAERARDRHHLTARMTGRVAREAGVKHLVPMHFSPKYIGREHGPEQEALSEFSAKA